MIDELREKLDQLKGMNRNRFSYVLARSRLPSIKAACEEVGVTQSWYYSFSLDERAELERLAEELKYSRELQTEYDLVALLGMAVEVYKDALAGRNKSLGVTVSKDLFDRFRIGSHSAGNDTITLNIDGLADILNRAYNNDSDTDS